MSKKELVRFVEKNYKYLIQYEKDILLSFLYQKFKDDKDKKEHKLIDFSNMILVEWIK
ncbi:TPA: hypothetical protein ACICD0_001396 [Campylobacter jejuni]